MNSEVLMTLSNKIADLARIKAMIAYMEAEGEIIVNMGTNGLHLTADRAVEIRSGIYAHLKVLQGELRHDLYGMGVNPDAGDGAPVATNGHDAMDAGIQALEDDAKPRADGLSD